MSNRVLYAIEHQRPGHSRWIRPGSNATFVSAVGDAAAQEIAERFQLTDAPVVHDGCSIRVRVWPEPDSIHALLAFDLDVEPAAGAWTFDPNA
jgi:hypothetical protein